jgi:PTH2 family peptidyl-tRNA hydrolase
MAVLEVLWGLPSIPGWLSTTCFVGSLGVLYYAKKIQDKTMIRRNEGSEASTVKYSAFDDFKMVLLIRTDLNMQKGKVAAQCCHATLSVYKQAMSKSPGILSAWENSGQAKITLKVNSEQEL